MAFGYLGQTLGLLTTTASRSCVICSLHCVFVAIIAELLRVQRARDAGAIDGSDAATFDLKRLIPAIVAVTGVAIVELTGAAGGPNVGDALSVAQPVRFPVICVTFITYCGTELYCAGAYGYMGDVASQCQSVVLLAMLHHNACR